jgi:hypothetical protein
MTIPNSIISDIISSTGNLMASVQPLLLVIFGIAVAFFLARNLLSLFDFDNELAEDEGEDEYEQGYSWKNRYRSRE